MQDKWNKFWLRQQIHACVLLAISSTLKVSLWLRHWEKSVWNPPNDCTRTMQGKYSMCNWFNAMIWCLSFHQRQSNIQNECMISFAASHRNNNVCFKSSVSKMKPYAFLTVRTYTWTHSDSIFRWKSSKIKCMCECQCLDIYNIFLKWCARAGVSRIHIRNLSIHFENKNNEKENRTHTQQYANIWFQTNEKNENENKIEKEINPKMSISQSAFALSFALTWPSHVFSNLFSAQHKHANAWHNRTEWKTERRS